MRLLCFLKGPSIEIGDRNHSQANRSRAFRVEVMTSCLVTLGIPCWVAYLGERPRNQETMRFR